MIVACREAHHVTDKSLILVNFLKNRLKELKIYYVLLVSNIFFSWMLIKNKILIGVYSKYIHY